MPAEIAALVGESRAHVGTAEESSWFDRLDGRRGELDDWVGGLFDEDPRVRLVEAAAMLWPYWNRRARNGSNWLRRAYDATLDEAPSEPLAELRYAAGLAAFRAGDNDLCVEMSAAALRAAESVGSDRERARAHIGLCRAAFRRGDFEGGIALADLADLEAERAGSSDLRTTAMHMRAELTRAHGDYAACVPMYEQLLAADLAAGDTRSLAMEHYNLGSVLVQAGDLDAARPHLTEALRLARQNQVDHLHYALLGMAGLLARTGDARLAARLLGAVQAQLDVTGEVLDPAEALELDTHLRAGRARADDFDDVLADSRGLSLDEAVALLPDHAG